MTSNKKCKRALNAIKTKLTAFVTYVDSFGHDVNECEVVQLQLRLSMADNYLSEYDQQNDVIIMNCSDNEVNEVMLEREEFASNYFIAISRAQLQLKRLLGNVSQSSNQTNVTNNVEVNTIKLPNIQLPKFDGSYNNWLEFRDLYESLIHSNVSINNIQKFHYLRLALIGSAAEVINSLEFSAANYIIAWQLLCERYDNKSMLINNHLKGIFEIPKIYKESANAIRRLVDGISKHLRALQSLG